MLPLCWVATTRSTQRLLSLKSPSGKTHCCPQSGRSSTSKRQAEVNFKHGVCVYVHCSEGADGSTVRLDTRILPVWRDSIPNSSGLPRKKAKLAKVGRISVRTAPVEEDFFYDPQSAQPRCTVFARVHRTPTVFNGKPSTLHRTIRSIPLNLTALRSFTLIVILRKVVYDLRRCPESSRSTFM